MASYLESILEEIYGSIPNAGAGMLGRGNYGGTGFGDAGSRQLPFQMYGQKKKDEAQPKKRRRLVDVLFDDLREAPFRPAGGGGGSGGSGGSVNINPPGVQPGGYVGTPVVNPNK